jgi:hypothetical protein
MARIGVLALERQSYRTGLDVAAEVDQGETAVVGLSNPQGHIDRLAVTSNDLAASWMRHISEDFAAILNILRRLYRMARPDCDERPAAGRHLARRPSLR